MKSEKTELVVFDFDGVLCSISWEGFFDAYKMIFKFLGQDYRNFFVTKAEFKSWYSLKDRNSGYEKVLVVPEEKKPSVRKIFHDYYDSRVSLFPWVHCLLENLSKKRVLAIFSGSEKSSIMARLGKSEKFFKIIIGSEDVKNQKPDPGGLLFILKETGINPQDTLFLGDMKRDIEAGKNANTKTGAVMWGIDNCSELLKLKPDYSFFKPSDLLKI